MQWTHKVCWSLLALTRDRLCYMLQRALDFLAIDTGVISLESNFDFLLPGCLEEILHTDHDT